jgi:hypothetical protein
MHFCFRKTEHRNSLVLNGQRAMARTKFAPSASIAAFHFFIATECAAHQLFASTQAAGALHNHNAALSAMLNSHLLGVVTLAQRRKNNPARANRVSKHCSTSLVFRRRGAND